MRAFLVFALLILTGAPAKAQPGASPPVVVVSAPGVSYTVVKEYLERGVLPRDGGFGSLMQQGLLAPLRPIHSPETGPSRASLWTGKPPAVHGIVGNSFRKPGERLAEGTGDFDEPLLAETVLDAARRGGKRVVRLIDWPPSRLPVAGGLDFLPRTLSRSAILEFQVEGAPAQPHRQFLRMTAVSAPLEILLSDNRGKALLELGAAADAPEYRVRLALQGRVGPWVKFRQGSWACVRLAGGSATWIRVITDPERLAGAKGRVYVGPIVEPANHRLISAFERAQGLWPGRPEGGLLRAGRISEEMWWEQAERLHPYHLRLGAFILRRNQADLLVVDMSWLDSAGHIFVVEHPRQAAYQAEGGAKKIRWNGHMEKSYRLLDEAIVALRKAAPPGARFLVVSDHGMMPAHTAVPLQRLFGTLGWEVRHDKDPDVVTYASFNSAHVYIAVRRRAEVSRLVDYLKSVTDPATGERVIAEVRTGDEIKESGFASERSGDVWVLTKPGYEIASEPDADWKSASMNGMHGYRGSEAQNIGLIGAAGPGINAGMLKDASVPNFSSFLSSLLGIQSVQRLP